MRGLKRGLLRLNDKHIKKCKQTFTDLQAVGLTQKNRGLEKTFFFFKLVFKHSWSFPDRSV